MFSDSLPAQEPAEKSSLPSLAPAYLLSGIIVVLNGLAWLGRPLAGVAPWVLAASGVGVLWLLLKNRPAAPRWIAAACALLCAWLALSDLRESFAPTGWVSAHPDVWSYDAVAGYLKDFGRERTEGMPIVDQFGAHLRNSRFTSSCLLVLCKIVAGPQGTFTAHTIFVGAVLFVTYCSMCTLAGRLGVGRFGAHASAAVSVLIGWTANAVRIGNYDNLCFVALLPAALVALLQMPDAGRNWWRNAAGLAVVTAAILYTYPEGAALSGPAILSVLAACFFQSKQRLVLLGRMAAAAGLALLLWLPYAPYFITFLVKQYTFAASGTGTLPGSGNFTGLLSSRFLPSIFALGTEYPTAIATIWSFLLATVLLGLLLVGVWRLAATHRWLLPSALCVCLLFVWQALAKHYDYGVYKVLFCHAWLIVPAMVAGCQVLHRNLPRPAGAVVLAGLLVAVFAERWHHRGERIWPQTQSVAALEELHRILPITKDAPVFLALHNDFDQVWALTILRDAPLVVAERRGYLAMSHVQPSLNSGRFVPVNQGDVFLLDDGQKNGAAWQNSRFHLEHNPGVVILSLENPNGKEVVGDKPFIWIGHSKESVITVQALRAGDYVLESSAWWIGPSLPETGTRTLVVQDAAGERTLTANAAVPQITLHLKEGENSIHLHVAESPSLLLQPNGDRRELMLGMLGYFVKPAAP